MASQIKKTKKQRKPKTSKGIHGGGGKVTLTAVQLVLIGKGMAHSKKRNYIKPKPYEPEDK